MNSRYLLMAIGLMSSLSVLGQSYYDDDIYYNPSKNKTNQATTVVKTTTTDKSLSDLDYEGSTYQIYSSDLRDVDEYNRRGGIYKSDTIPQTDSLNTNSDTFKYTERIERFDNPTIIIASSDSRLKELYYSDDVDIYIGTPTTYISFGGFYDPWYSPFYSSWYYNPWHWNWGWSWGWNSFNPWWGGYYDPFWGPHYHGYYGYTWGGWHNHWGPSHWGGWGHRPAYSDGGRRPFGGRTAANNNSSFGRSGFNGQDTHMTTGRRPSSASYQRAQRPTQSMSGSTTHQNYTTNGYRGGSIMNQNTTVGRRPSNSTTERRSQYTTRDSNNSYNNSHQSTSGTRNSGSSYRGGSSNSSRGSFGGGGSRGSFGGGGSHGGRR